MNLDPTEQTALGQLATEGVDPRFAGIDRMSVAELAATLNQADAGVSGAVAQALPQIVPAIEATAARMASGGRLLYVGAGTPGRIGFLDASECLPAYGAPPEQVFAIIAGGPGVLVSPVEEAEDDSGAGIAAIDEAQIGPLDTVVGIGRTPFVVAAVERAWERGALTVGLSTIVMVHLGKTYGNLMVDLLVTNDKLRDRAICTIMTVTRADRADASEHFERNDRNVKQAIVAHRLNLAPHDAAACGARHHGHLRAALGEQA
jgi:N-acetylmuramic acid 6-phosphate etherase